MSFIYKRPILFVKIPVIKITATIKFSWEPL